jgi:effector-binding domain-containing protein
MRTYEIELHDLREEPTAVVRATLAVSELPEFFSHAFAEVAGHIQSHGTYPAGMPFARFDRLEDGRFEVEAGFPVAGPIPGGGRVMPSHIPAGPAISLCHVGPYDSMEPAYQAVADWLAENDAVAAGPPWEVYTSDPSEDPADYRTQIVQPYVRMGSPEHNPG